MAPVSGAGTRPRTAVGQANNTGGPNQVSDPVQKPPSDVEAALKELEQKLGKIFKPDAEALAGGKLPPRPGRELPAADKAQAERAVSDFLLKVGLDQGEKYLLGPKANSPQAAAVLGTLKKLVGSEGLKLKLGDKGDFTLKAELGNWLQKADPKGSASVKLQLTKNTELTGSANFNRDGFDKASGGVSWSKDGTKLTATGAFNKDGFERVSGGFERTQGRFTTTATGTLNAQGGFKAEGGVTFKNPQGVFGLKALQDFQNGSTRVEGSLKRGTTNPFEVTSGASLKNGVLSSVDGKFKWSLDKGRLTLQGNALQDFMKGTKKLEGQVSYKPGADTSFFAAASADSKNGFGVRFGAAIRF
ncbi:hypothetical protein COCOR_02300 [Corallococcus coralloides DSM 2259]|uniref:Uncharacterized protein n=1 Tax=Corallococcus coralloides (strain ATCC 25202 / DSM 2259 / NBRC 100086 / M2) TaxID=1144275 RepID=H8MLV2_CORCM|nr:hypothetical protein [Corallococcus coralloides]AFE04589.1 hypothetical protein COCOR_02300 [Corallococcus coralloides DSM 2259]